jgi:hypothetical protein
MKAVGSKLMVNLDGTMKPLTIRQRVLYKNRQELLEEKLKSARRKAVDICEKIEEMETKDDCMKDVALMRKFILEQVSVFYRFTLKKLFADIEGMPPEVINPYLWVLSWIAMIGAQMFLLYWIFAWGITNGGDTLEHWGTDYGVAAVQDIFLCEVVLILVLFVLVVMSAKPQLQVIKRVINERAMSLVQDGVDFTEHVTVIQHFSPACRVARMSGMRHLSSAAILRNINDADIEKCKRYKNFTTGGTPIFYCIVVVAAIAVFGEIFIVELTSATISSMWLSFLLVNVKLLDISPLIIVVIYAALGGLIAYRVGVFTPSLYRARASRLRRLSLKRNWSRSHSKRDTADSFFWWFYELIDGIKKSGKKIRETFDHVNLNHFSGEKSNLTREKQRYVNLTWCRMNIISSLQGNTTSIEEDDAFKVHSLIRRRASLARIANREVRKSYHRKSFSLKLDPVSDHVLPIEILQMRQTGLDFDIGSIEDQSNLFVVKLFGAVSIESIRPEAVEILKKKKEKQRSEILTSCSMNEQDWALSIGGEQPVRRQSLSNRSGSLTTTTYRGKKAKRYRTATLDVTCDSQVALQRMLRRHILGIEASERGEDLDLDEVNRHYVTLSSSEAVELLDWIWGTFHPGREELSEEGRQEAEDIFMKWQGDKTRSDFHIDNEKVRFDVFSAWFLSLSNRISHVIQRPREENLVEEKCPIDRYWNSVFDRNGAQTSINYTDTFNSSDIVIANRYDTNGARIPINYTDASNSSDIDIGNRRFSFTLIPSASTKHL